MFKVLKSMPPALLGLYLVFLAIPLAGAVLFGPPWGTLFQSTSLEHAALILLSYWVIPLALCFTLTSRHHWFLPLYLSLCALLVAALVAGDFQPRELRVTHYLLIGTMLYVGLLFGNRNFLYPLLTKDPRYWRRAARYRIGRNVKLLGSDTEREIRALLLDCSSTGLGVSIGFDEMSDHVASSLGKGRKLEIEVCVDDASGSERFVLPVEIVWTIDLAGGERKIGCHATDRAVIKRYLDAEVLKRGASARTSVLGDDYALERYIQKTALILWLVCIALTFALPGFVS